jgi:hypothetical protein
MSALRKLQSSAAPKDILFTIWIGVLRSKSSLSTRLETAPVASAPGRSGAAQEPRSESQLRSVASVLRRVASASGWSFGPPTITPRSALKGTLQKFRQTVRAKKSARLAGRFATAATPGLARRTFGPTASRPAAVE